jgi:hypothetical protein
MAGMDTVLATTLARRLDSLLGLGQGASSGAPSAVAGAQPTGDATSALGNLATRTAPAAVGLGNTTAQTAARAPTPVQQATLSAAARTIDTILRLAPDSPGPVQASTPVWPAAPGTGAPALAPLLAAALKEALSTSGLFYESHLAQWASGSRSFEQLQAEPQLRWPASANLAAQLRAAGADATLPGPGPLTRLLGPAAAEASLAAAWPLPGPAASPTAGPSAAQPGLPAQAAAGDAADGGLHAAANLPNTANALAHAASVAHTTSSVLPTGREGNASDALAAAGDGNANAVQHGPAGAIAAVANAPAESVTLVRQQLDMLVNPQFQWNGAAWPGAPMEWQVEERPGQPAPGEAAAASTWHTHLRLTLPSLGTVDVNIGLSGQQLQARLLTDSAASADWLSQEGEALRQRLAAVGLIASQLSFGALGEDAEAGSAGIDAPPVSADLAGVNAADPADAAAPTADGTSRAAAQPAGDASQPGGDA